MRAVQIVEHGGPETLHVADVPIPDPGPGRMRVKVGAAGLNYIDTYHRRGLYPVELPFTLGLEGAGIVDDVGPDVAGFQIGDRVAWTSAPGSYAEYTLVAAEQAVHVPDDVPIDVAAAAMLQGLTAHYLVNDTFPLQADQRCLIHAGAGGVGRLLIQMAKRHGAFVYATAGGAEKVAVAEAAGADVGIDYKAEDFVEAITAHGGDRPLHVVYDGVGRDTFLRDLEVLRRRGMAVLFGQSSGPVEPFDLQLLNKHGSLYVTRPSLFHYVATRQELEHRARELFAAIADGWLDVLIGARFPLAEAAEAHRALEGRKTIGKVLLIP